MLLIHFMPLVSFYAPLKTLENLWFFMFAGVIEREQLHEMG